MRSQNEPSNEIFTSLKMVAMFLKEVLSILKSIKSLKKLETKLVSIKMKNFVIIQLRAASSRDSCNPFMLLSSDIIVTHVNLYPLTRYLVSVSVLSTKQSVGHF